MKFLFDNNMSHPLAKALRLLSQPVVHVRDLEGLGQAAPDDLILNYAASRGYFVVTKDRAILRTPQFRAIIEEEGIGFFLLRQGKARRLRAWDEAKLIIKAWDKTMAYAKDTQIPFVAEIQTSGAVRQARVS
jgi:hypothetical protein